MFRAEKAREYVKKRHIAVRKEIKKNIRERICRAIRDEETHLRYNYAYTPTGELYPEIKEWLISLGYKVETSEVTDEWIISWE